MIIRALLSLCIVLIFAKMSFADLNNGLIAYYPFNGNANDESGNGIDGIVDGASLTDDRLGNSNTAYKFDGINDHIGMGYNVWSKSDLLSSSYTCWVKVGTNPSYVINIEGSIFYRVSHFTIDATGGEPNCYISWPEDGEWHFFAATVKPNGLNHEVKCYMDGVLQDTSYESFSHWIDSRNSRFVLGMVPVSDWSPSADGGWFGGDIDEVRIYNRVLTDTEIQELFNEPQMPIPTPTPTPAPPQELIDTDSDGVINQWDECPGTLLGSPVYSNGCVPEDIFFQAEVDLMINLAVTEAEAAKDQIISQLEQEIADKNQIISDLNDTIIAKDQIISDLTVTIDAMFTKDELDEAIEEACPGNSEFKGHGNDDEDNPGKGNGKN